MPLFFFLKKKLLNCLEKSDSDLQKNLSFKLSSYWQERMDHRNGFSECLIQVSMKDWKIIPESHETMVKQLFQSRFLNLKFRVLHSHPFYIIESILCIPLYK